jgi:hypothetical protein
VTWPGRYRAGERVTSSYHVVMLEEVDPRASVALRNLWQLYRHDLSEYRNMVPEVDGKFHTRSLDAYIDTLTERR